MSEPQGSTECTCTIIHKPDGSLSWYYKSACPTSIQDHTVWNVKFQKVLDMGVGWGRVEDGDFLQIDDGKVCHQYPALPKVHEELLLTTTMLGGESPSAYSIYAATACTYHPFLTSPHGASSGLSRTPTTKNRIQGTGFTELRDSVCSKATTPQHHVFRQAYCKMKWRQLQLRRRGRPIRNHINRRDRWTSPLNLM